MMKLDMFINFDGNCREAAAFYAKVFHSEVQDLMTYSESPPDPSYTVPEADRDKIMYVGIPMGNMVLMCMDMPSDSPLAVGNNINPTIGVEEKDEATRIFNELKAGGKVYMEMQTTFFCEWYGMVEDKFGVIWHVMHNLA